MKVWKVEEEGAGEMALAATRAPRDKAARFVSNDNRSTEGKKKPLGRKGRRRAIRGKICTIMMARPGAWAEAGASCICEKKQVKDKNER